MRKPVTASSRERNPAIAPRHWNPRRRARDGDCTARQRRYLCMKSTPIVVAIFFVTLARCLTAAEPTTREPLGIALEGYDYPYPVRYFSLTIEHQDLRMAYMDVAPADGSSTAGTVVLFHGKNFFGAYWKDTIAALTAAGYRVIVPDQIGFGKSSKPDIHYSLHLLAANTRQLLESLGINKAAVTGHSM